MYKAIIGGYVGLTAYLGYEIICRISPKYYTFENTILTYIINFIISGIVALVVCWLIYTISYPIFKKRQQIAKKDLHDKK
jgi:phosphate/sulfate permease